MDLRFPQDEHDIPMLSLERQAFGLDLPMMAWGSIKRGRPMRGTYHMYVHDHDFIRVWDNPDIVVQTECAAVVEPNFSVFTDTPLPVALWAIYRKRWLARYWQERGINIWVDLRVAPAWRDINLLGVPPGWQCYATRGYADDLPLLDHDYATARQRCGGEPRFLQTSRRQCSACSSRERS